MYKYELPEREDTNILDVHSCRDPDANWLGYKYISDSQEIGKLKLIYICQWYKNEILDMLSNRL